MISINYTNYKSFLSLHSESILEYCNTRSTGYKKTRLDVDVKTYFGSIIADFKALIEASPEKLKEIKKYYDAQRAPIQNAIKAALDVTTLYVYFAANNDRFSANSQNIQYHARYLTSNLDVLTCPYCNEHFTYSFAYERRNEIIRRTFDLDHVYSQESYPFFAISFFNLVPCCKVCNHIKLDEDANYFNPHLSVNIDDAYFFDLKPLDPGFISDASKIQLDIRFKSNKYTTEVKETMSVVALLNRMRCHKELVRDIINKKRIYTNEYVNSLKAQISYLRNIDVVTLKRTIHGVYFDHKDYHKRPFSKLTSDILFRKYS
jgi:hypothetical protein